MRSVPVGSRTTNRPEQVDEIFVLQALPRARPPKEPLPHRAVPQAERYFAPRGVRRESGSNMSFLTRISLLMDANDLSFLFMI